MRKKKKAVTLLELILAITFLSVIVLGLNSINQFSHFQTVNTDRRARIQNQLVILVEHMRREMTKAIGNESVFGGADSVINTYLSNGNTAIKVYVDSGVAYATGVNAIYAAGDGQRGSPTDRWIAYRFTGGAILPVTNRYQIWFCSRCVDTPNCNTCDPANATAWGNDIVAKNIQAFALNPAKPPGTVLSNNSITVAITACWDPSIPENVDNSCITTNVLITMPSVNAH